LINRRRSRLPKWPDCLRDLRGGKVAVVSFFLTLALGLGAPAAIALWNQTGKVSVSIRAGSTVKPEPRCTATNGSGSPYATVSWDSAATAAAQHFKYTVRYGSTLYRSGIGTSVVIDQQSLVLTQRIYEVTIRAYYSASESWASEEAVMNVVYKPGVLGLLSTFSCPA
jgi:hypothetical protein